MIELPWALDDGRMSFSTSSTRIRVGFCDVSTMSYDTRLGFCDRFSKADSHFLRWEEDIQKSRQVGPTEPT